MSLFSPLEEAENTLGPKELSVMLLWISVCLSAAFIKLWLQFFCAVVCWRGGMTDRDMWKLDKLVQRSRPVLDCPLDSVDSVAERRC